MLSVSKSKEDIQVESRTNENIKCNQKLNPFCLLCCTYGLGMVFLSIGLITCGFWKQFYDQRLISELSLSNISGSQTTALWLTSDIPQYLKVYMFNWTNPELSLAGKEVPDFQECGPYVFRTYAIKDGIVWNDNDTVSYLLRRRWTFIPEMSNGSLSDEIISINVVAIAFTYQLKYMSKFLLTCLNAIIKWRQIPLIIRNTVSNHLFDGYDDGILPILKTIGDAVHSYGFFQKFVEIKEFLTKNKNSTEDGSSIASQILDKLQKLDNIKDQFAWWYQKNVTEAHHYNVHTGQNNINKLGDIYSWDFKTICTENKKISGSLGDLWPMNTPNKRRASIFIPEMCSFFDLSNVGPKQVDGIDGIKFSGDRESLGLTRNDLRSEFTGVQNITKMVKAPIFISYPHFYEANKTFLEAVKGLKPSRQKHEFYVVLQKDSGVVLEGNGRIQVNVMLEPIEQIQLVANLPKLLFPTIWFEQTAEIPKYLMNQLKFGFVTVPNVLPNIGIIIITIGVLFLVIGFVFVHLFYKFKPYKEILNFVMQLRILSKSPNNVIVPVQKQASVT